MHNVPGCPNDATINGLKTKGIDLDRKVVLALNMIDLSRDMGIVIDINHLQNQLGVPIIPINARKRKGLEALKETSVKKLAVSPLINGKAVKGPAEKIMTSLGMQADAIGIASFYEDLIDTLIIDNID